MSGVVEHAMFLEEYGLNSVPDKFVCPSHFKEKALKDFIRNVNQKGKCDYCGKGAQVRPLEEIMVQLMKVVNFFYTDPANFMPYDSSEGGYHDESNIYTSFDVLFYDFELNIEHPKLLKDVEDSLDYSSAWSDENKYTNNPSEHLAYEWDEFKNIVKHKARYLFFEVINDRIATAEYSINENPLDILKSIGEKIISFKLVQKLPAGTVFYRCRQHSNAEKITEPAQMCSPDVQYIRNPNRMSPSGISMFYGAFDLKTSKMETLNLGDASKKLYTYANFRSKEELLIVDFSKLPPPVSIWDVDNLDNFYPLRFLHDFVKDLSKPISRDGLEHIEYVPTQIITEYLRYSFRHIHESLGKIDGIIFPSSKTGNTNSCVLFMDHLQSLERLSFDITTLKTQVIK